MSVNTFTVASSAYKLHKRPMSVSATVRELYKYKKIVKREGLKPRPKTTRFGKDARYAKKTSKNSPSPTHYQKLEQWKPVGITKWKHSKTRVLFTEEFLKGRKFVPAPNNYQVRDIKKLKLGKIMKCEGVGFMEGTISHAQRVPEPTKYNKNHALTE